MKKMYVVLTLAILAAIVLIFAIDRVRLNHKFSKFDDKIREKDKILEKTKSDYEEELNRKNTEIDLFAQRFQVITTERELLGKADKKDEIPEKQEIVHWPTEDKNKKEKQRISRIKEYNSSILPRICKTPEDLAIAEKLAKAVKEPTLPEVKRVFMEYLTQNEKKTSKLYVDEKYNRLMDQDAAILEEMCALLDIKAKTTIRWYMQDANMPHSCVTVLTKEQKKDATHDQANAKRAMAKTPVQTLTLEYGQKGKAGSPYVAQNKAITTVLSLNPIRFRNFDEQHLLLKIHDIPVGGLYVLKLNISLDKSLNTRECLLEIVYPQPKTPDAPPFSLQMLALSTETEINAVLKDNRQTFRIKTGTTGVSELLLLGDRTCIPETIIAYPIPVIQK